ncbi:MAG TPA: prephenate dehydrogenase/arogenate dehydrogenase family protein [Acidisarcina sp.]|nr:prephenate dehydrogenase/arogenate dehydrogenase family protein [Acidisarcina sp.]
MLMERITILGTGLVGTSVGLALRAHGFSGTITGWDRDPKQLQIALSRGAVDIAAIDAPRAVKGANLVVLSGPVFAIVGWMEQLSACLTPGQLVTDVGSTKRKISVCAQRWFNQPGRAGFLPGHPMAGKEVSGAANGEATLFDGAVWLFTPANTGVMDEQSQAIAAEWREWIVRFGSRIMELDAMRHDELCAWVSHLPQMVSTALTAMLEDKFGAAEDMRAIGGRALREMTRLGCSPYSMWRDIAHTNSDDIAAALLALEQRLAHLREHLKTPELREEFERANQFRLCRPVAPDPEQA